jgi:hypothetical protein
MGAAEGMRERESKFKVGDTVRRIGTDCGPAVSVGAIGTVEKIHLDDAVYVNFPGHHFCFSYEKYLELVDHKYLSTPGSPPSPSKGSSGFTVKDSGQRTEFSSGMVRDTSTGKTDWELIFNGPMAERWAEHLTKGSIKYPDPVPGQANWMRADGPEELARFKKSAVRHFVQWLRGDVDEDHAAAVFFNINGAEYVKRNHGEQLSVKQPGDNGQDHKELSDL